MHLSGVERLRRQLLVDTVRNGLNLPFYQARWPAVDLTEAEIVEGFSALPIIDKADIIYHQMDLFRPGEANCYRVSHTSGTTGAPLYRLRSLRDVQFVGRFVTALTRDRISRRGWFSLSTDQAPLAHRSAIPYPTGSPVIRCSIWHRNHFSRFVELMESTNEVAGISGRVRELLLTSHEFLMLTSVLAERGLVPRERFVIDTAWIFGGFVSQPTMERLSEFWDPVAIVDTYSMCEVLGSARSCMRCGWYHFGLFAFPEVVDAVTEEPLFEGEGILVLSELFPFVRDHPLIRYWTGDLVEVTQSDCDKSNISIRYLGRVPMRRGRVIRQPGFFAESDASEAVMMGEPPGLPHIVVRPVPLINLLNSIDAVARRPLDGLGGGIRDPLRLGRPRFSINVGSGSQPAVELRVLCERSCSPTDRNNLSRKVGTEILRQNPELRRFVSAGRVRLEVTIESVGTGEDAAPPGTEGDGGARH